MIFSSNFPFCPCFSGKKLLWKSMIGNSSVYLKHQMKLGLLLLLQYLQ